MLRSNRYSAFPENKRMTSFSTCTCTGSTRHHTARPQPHSFVVIEARNKVKHWAIIVCAFKNNIPVDGYRFLHCKLNTKMESFVVEKAASHANRRRHIADGKRDSFSVNDGLLRYERHPDRDVWSSSMRLNTWRHRPTVIRIMPIFHTFFTIISVFLWERAALTKHEKQIKASDAAVDYFELRARNFDDFSTSDQTSLHGSVAWYEYFFLVVVQKFRRSLVSIASGSSKSCSVKAIGQLHMSVTRGTPVHAGKWRWPARDRIFGFIYCTCTYILMSSTWKLNKV